MGHRSSVSPGFAHSPYVPLGRLLTTESGVPRGLLFKIDPKLINHSDLMTITQSLSRQMQRLMDYEYHLQTGDLRQRVARYLISLSETPLAAENADGYMVVSATHELIAEGTASTRESVSKIITELRSEGLIESGYRSIVLLQPDELDEISQGF